MNKTLVLVVVTLVIAVGVSAFALTSSNTDVFSSIIQEPVVLEEKVSVLDNINPFSAPTTIAQSMKAAQPAPNVTIGDDGKIYVLYQDTFNEETNIFLKTSTDNGKSFSGPVRVNLIDNNVALDGRVAPTIQLGDNGEVYVTWANSRYEPNMFMGNYRQLIFTQSFNDGKSFEPSIVIGSEEQSSGKYFQHMNVDSLGTIHMAWLDGPSKMNATGYMESDKSRDRGVRYTQSMDGGETFQTTKLIDANACPCCNVQTAADGEGNVYVSWRKVFGSGDTQVRDMVIATSTDGGKTFSNPVKINDDGFQFKGCVHVGAPMAIDSAGTLHVTWYTGATDKQGMYYATSTDNGQSFSEPLPILTGDWVPPQRVYIAIDNNDTVWLTWEDATGLSANEKTWRYGDTQAMIYTAQIIDGVMFKFENPVNVSDGKSPAIDSSDGVVSIVWTENDNSVKIVTHEN
jgi:hypothetical protein